jgi:hypothetical protein
MTPGDGYLCTCRYPWVRNMWIPMGTDGYLRVPTGRHWYPRYPRVPMGTHGCPWVPVGTWVPMCVHVTSVVMGTCGHPCHRNMQTWFRDDAMGLELYQSRLHVLSMCSGRRLPRRLSQSPPQPVQLPLSTATVTIATSTRLPLRLPLPRH